ncbi:MAG: hypothetical protein KatS3mg105_2489 [Gemmatales bacterium]|nr:MAG: hypothetical protein KatS3mg105_2489 [Gemmatales bacterium]
MMAWESIERLITPVAIAFNQAILVAVIGLVVNAVSVFILGHEHDHDHEDGHHQHDDHHEHHHLHGHHGNGLEHDHNLRAAYFHVLADALTSLLAIFALLAGKYFHLVWMDPVMGLVGAALVTRWSIGLLRTTSAVLLDRNGPAEIRERVIQSLESHDDNRVADLHLWQIAPGAYALIVSVVTHEPKAPDYYKSLLPGDLGLKHVTVEVHQCHDDPQWPCNDKATAEFAASNR